MKNGRRFSGEEIAAAFYCALGEYNSMKDPDLFSFIIRFWKALR